MYKKFPEAQIKILTQVLVDGIAVRLVKSKVLWPEVLIIVNEIITRVSKVDQIFHSHSSITGGSLDTRR